MHETFPNKKLTFATPLAELSRRSTLRPKGLPLSSIQGPFGRLYENIIDDSRDDRAIVLASVSAPESGCRQFGLGKQSPSLSKPVACLVWLGAALAEQSSLVSAAVEQTVLSGIAVWDAGANAGLSARLPTILIHFHAAEIKMRASKSA